MRSTFMGLETSKRGMFTQQTALYTTGHNISNANTPGFSRQKVNMQPTLPFPGIGLNAGKIPGFIGTGVEAHSIQRIRDQFIDRQYRQESNALGYWNTRTEVITQVEDVLSEPSDFGLNESLDLFWKSLGDLSSRPENAGTRRVVIERGIAVADSFNYINKQLTDIQGNLKNEIDVSTKDINSLLKQIASINENIQKIEPNGYMPNDLYDERDNLLDELSEYFPIEISYNKSGGNSLAIAEGTVDVSIKKSDGTTIKLVEGKEYTELVHNISMTNTTNDPFTQLTFNGLPAAAGDNIIFTDFNKNEGRLASLINSYGYTAPGTTGVTGYLPGLISEMDSMASAFMNEFNRIHATGYTLSDKSDLDPNNWILSATGQDFFQGTGAGDMKVRNDIINNENLVAASTSYDQEGNGLNSLNLADVKSKSLINGASIQTFYESLVGRIGVDGEQATRLQKTTANKQLTIGNNRAAVSSVSLDEEMTNMIMFQQAYNASARMITVVDETLDKIINGMGRVGL